MDSQYLPTDEESKDLFHKHLEGHSSCWCDHCDVDYDLEEICKQLKNFVSKYVERALSPIKVEQQVVDTSTDQHTASEEQKTVEHPQSSESYNDAQIRHSNDANAQG